MARSVAEFREENQKKNLGRIENLERRLKAVQMGFLGTKIGDKFKNSFLPFLL